MALQVSRAGRKRSSTSASKGLSADERESPTAELVRKLVFTDAVPSSTEVRRLSETTAELRTTIGQDASARDTFRHAHGFETILEMISNFAENAEPVDTEQTVSLIKPALLVLAASLREHRGNQKYFYHRLDGWASLKDSLGVTQVRLLGLPDRAAVAQAIAALYESLLAFAIDKDDFQMSDAVGDVEVHARDADSGEGTFAEPTVLAQGSKLRVHGLVENPQAAYIAVCLAIASAVDHKSFQSMAIALLRAVAALVEESVGNEVAIWQTGILSELLPIALNARGNVEEQVRSTALDLTSCLAADLGLVALDDVAGLFRQARGSGQARVLLLRVLQQSKGPAFVQFDLSRYGYSSIELPSLPRAFPPTTGYTLAAWIRIDAYDANVHTTVFGAFDASQACFIMVYLERDSHQLILQTSIRSSRPSVRFKSTRFAVGRWYHLALVHRKAADSRHSPAVLFVDGEFAEQLKCAYPDTPPEYEDKHANTTSPGSAGRRSMPVQAFLGTPHDLAMKIGRDEVFLKWSFASAHLYATPLTDEFVSVHQHLGPRYSGNFQDCLGPLLTYRASAELNRYNELLHPDRSEKSDIVTATEGRGSDVVSESRLLMSISPSAIVIADGTGLSQVMKYDLDRRAMSRYHQLMQSTRAFAVNAAVPTFNEAISRSYGTGILTGEPVIAIPKALDNATWCLAGCLPLIIGLLESANTKSAFLQAVNIYFECIGDSWRISEEMEKRNGFGMFALIIREKLGFETGSSTTAPTRKPAPMLSFEDRQDLPLDLLRLILSFVGYKHFKPEDSMIVNPMAYRVLLVDFDTWRRCDIETQILYYGQFAHLTDHNRHQSFNFKRLTRMRVVRKLIEALKSEEITSDAVGPLMKALRALLDNQSASMLYKDLAMFVAYGLQDERARAPRPMLGMASIVNLRQRTASWANHARGSRPSTPGGAVPSRSALGLLRSELAIYVLQLITDILCGDRSVTSVRRFNKAVPNRWLLHLLAEPDIRVINLTVRLISRTLAVLGQDFKRPFVDKNSGFVTLRSRLKAHWRSPEVWVACFSILLGLDEPSGVDYSTFSAFTLVEALHVGPETLVLHAEILPALMSLLEAGLRSAVKTDEPAETDTAILRAVIQFLGELYSRSPVFRDFATTSRYVQELLFVLYPVLVGSDRLSAETELQAEKDTLSFRGEEVKMRPHSNSLGERPPSVRSMNMDEDKRTPSPMSAKRVEGPRRLSSFVMINPNVKRPSPAQFNAALAPKKAESVKLNAGNALVESLLEVGINIFIDLICNKANFQGVGLFLKVPPGFREHQAYFESYILVNTLSQLWNHLKLDQALLRESRVLKNLSLYCGHLSEAVFEGWFIDGAKPVLDFTGSCLEYLQQPEVADNKNVRLCSQYIGNIRVVFLRITLWRLSELDEAVDEAGTSAFLDRVNYYQTILFSAENRETLFTRLICFQLYLKLVSDAQQVRLAAARLWRTVLIAKPTEAATLLTYAMGSDDRHLSTGFMRLVSIDDEEFLDFVHQNRNDLDTAFMSSLNKPWSDFVHQENQRNTETAQSRLTKRRERLRQWQHEDANLDDSSNRFEVSTHHWRTNVHAQERVKLQRAIQDQQEMINHVLGVFGRLDKMVQQPCGLEPLTGVVKWQLDETEALHRMRMRTTQDVSEQKSAFQPKRKYSQRNGKLAINTQVARVSDNIHSSLPGSPANANSVDGPGERRPRADSTSNSQLLEGAFEIVDDPKEDEDSGIVEDKNRKIMTNLQRGDQVQQLYNISRIVGLEACEGLLVIGQTTLYLQDNFFSRSDGEIVSVSSAPEDEKDPYVQLISGKDIGSQRTKHSIGDLETRHWSWAQVLSASKRRFLFREVAVEVFFTDGRSYLLTCISPKTRDDLYMAIVSRAPHVHGTASVANEDAWRLDTLRNPEEAPQSLGTRFATVFNSTPSYAATKKWVKGEMSNFQYLMLVNTLAGRTFNDLTQYPVFPWVLADYTSKELDLEDPKTFRDLSKPMGCQTASREAEYRDRFQQFAEMGDQNAPPFHYGTHYSSAMIVSSYLIRLQPFVQSYLLLQGGNFDHADRLFDSVAKAWVSASRDTMSDVRELTPEFFYLPEFLTNLNHYDFGVKQGGGGAVNDVQLPPWAKGDPHIFIAKHREALESPYVSEHLHKWVDLIFGYKQRGEAAIESTNVFQHLSYHGAKDLDTIDDPIERLATIGIIHSFGQTPHQVFQKAHPARELNRSAVARLDTLAESLVRLPDPLFSSEERVTGLTFRNGTLLCAGPCRLELLPNCERFMQWGFADNSVRFFSSSSKRLLGLNENTHIGPITTAIFADSKTLVTAGADCTIGVWTLSVTKDWIDLQQKTTGYLFGHRTPVTHLAASRVFSTLLSASSDGQVLVWGLNRLNCIRVLLPAGGPQIQAARVSNTTGHIALCQGSHMLVYTLNGHPLVDQQVCDSEDDEMACCVFYEGAGNEWLERELLLTGHPRGVAKVWALMTLPDGAWHLQLVKRLNHVDPSREDGGNTAAAITTILPTQHAVYTGDEVGRVFEWDCIQRQSSISVRGR